MTAQLGHASGRPPREYGCPVSIHDNVDIVEQLSAIVETLAERSIAVLRESIESGSTERPAAEKQLTQARRAVEKAISVLGGSAVTND